MNHSSVAQPVIDNAHSRLELSTICGRRQGDGVRSEGRPGVLALSPRLLLRVGGHRFCVRGRVPAGSPAAFVELIAPDGVTVMERVPLVVSEGADDLLATLRVHLQQDLDAAQIRVIVDVGHLAEIMFIEHLPNERWLVVSNCQTHGLANSLSLLLPNVDVDSTDVWGLHHDLQGWVRRLPQYSRLVLSPEVRNFGLSHADADPRVVWVPGVFFCAFHPDLCYVDVGGRMLKGPLDDYHSTIAVAAWRLGMSVRETLRFFNRETYQRVGYLDTWPGERDRLFAVFDAHGLDIRQEFLRWIRRGPFMYSINHPRIEVLASLARLAAHRAGREVRELDLLPSDNLVQGAVFPIYPEVAEALGLPGGAYAFKPPRRYELLDLREYIEACFSVYAQQPRDALRSMSPFLDRVTQHLTEFR